MRVRYSWVIFAVILMFSCASFAQDEEESERLWFSADSLNEGLGEVPEEVERSTPREAIRSFIELTENDEHSAAAHILNLSDIPASEQKSRGSRLAMQLSSVLRRGEWINISSLPGRQDALVQDPSGKHPRAGEPRRYLEVVSLKAQGQTYDVHLTRYKVAEQDPVWLISPETVDIIPILYEKFGPSWIEQYIPERYKQSLGMLQLWEWIAIPVFLVLIGSLGFGVYALVGLVKRWLPPGMYSMFAGRIGMPMAFIVMAIVTQILLGYVVSFSGAGTTFFRLLLAVITAWGAALIALHLVDTMLLKVTARLVGDIDDTKYKDERKLLTSLYTLRRTIILVTVVAAVIYVLIKIEIFETLGTTLLASASVAAVLAGIAGQAVLGNIMASFQVSLAKPIRIGDSILFEGQWCYVEGIFYTYIRLRVWDDRRLIVPVKYFVSQPFENWSAKSAKTYRNIVLTLHLNADVEYLREKFKTFAKQEEGVIEHDKLLCFVTGQTAAAQEITFYLMTPEPMAGWVAEMNVREKLLAFIRDNHPEWWPRDVVVISQQDVTRGDEKSDH
ncbi:mechanosensitive ion channel family protein [Halomonas sediminis]